MTREQPTINCEVPHVVVSMFVIPRVTKIGSTMLRNAESCHPIQKSLVWINPEPLSPTPKSFFVAERAAAYKLKRPVALTVECDLVEEPKLCVAY